MLSFLHGTANQEAADKVRLALPFGLGASYSIVAMLSLAAFLLILPVAAEPSPAAAADVRPCSALGENASAGKKHAKPQKKNAGQEETNAGAGCIEVHSSALGVQEQLQSFVRDRKWQVADEEIGESFWSFSMALSKEELLDYAKPDSGNDRVQWRSGKAVVLVKTADLSDGYARAVVSAHFEGFGEPEDAFAMKRQSWTLHSSGKLEAILTSALEAHYRAHP